MVQQGVVKSAADGGLMSSLPTVPPKTPPRIISGLEDVTLPKGKSAGNLGSLAVFLFTKFCLNHIFGISW